MSTLKEYLLEKITGFELERLIHELLFADGFLELRPLGGVHDRGIDGTLYASVGQDNNAWVVQISSQTDSISKVRNTIQKISKLQSAINASGLLYVTNMPVATRERESAEKLALEAGLYFEVLDYNWILPRVVLDEFSSSIRAITSAGPEYSLLSQDPGTPLPQSLSTMLSEAEVCAVNVAEKASTQQVSSLVTISYIFRYRGYAGHAQRYALQALRIADRLANPILQAITSHNLGEVLKQQERFSEAEQQFYQSLDFARQKGIKLWESTCLANLAQATLHKDIQAAISTAQASLDIRESTNSSPMELSISLGQLSDLWRKSQKIAESLEFARESLANMQDISAHRGIAIGSLRLAELLIIEGKSNVDQIVNYLAQSKNAAKLSNSDATLAAVEIATGDFLARIGKKDEALLNYIDAARISIKIADKRLLKSLRKISKL